MVFSSDSLLSATYLFILMVSFNSILIVQGEFTLSSPSADGIICEPADSVFPVLKIPRKTSEVEFSLRCRNLAKGSNSQTWQNGRRHPSPHWICHSILLFLLVISILMAVYHLVKNDVARFWQKLKSLDFRRRFPCFDAKDTSLQLIDNLENGFLKEIPSDTDYHSDEYFASSSDNNDSSFGSSVPVSSKQRQIQIGYSNDQSCITTPSPSLDSGNISSFLIPSNQFKPLFCDYEIESFTRVENGDHKDRIMTSTPVREYASLDEISLDLSLMQSVEDCDDESKSFTIATSFEDLDLFDNSFDVK